MVDYFLCIIFERVLIMKYGLVFAGGGTKGAYELGVWKAINKMNIEISAVTGASIGSINGALFAQDAFETAVDLWTSIKIHDIVALDKMSSDNLFDVKNIFNIVTEMYKNQGLDMSPLEKLLKQIIDEEKIRNSNIEYGLCTYSLSDRCRMELFIDDIPKGKLVDFLMASACLPGFQSKVIENKTFIDGAVNNNLPINMLIDKGYKNIIAVDVGGIGVIKNTDTTGINVINIKFEDNIIGTLDFDEDNISKSIKKGYYDCYKAFGRLYGDKYYFTTMSYFNAKSKYSDYMIECIEAAGHAFEIEKFSAYNFNEFILGVIEGYKLANKKYIELKNKISNENLFEIVGKSKPSDSFIVAWIVDIMKNDMSNWKNNKIIMNILGENYNAANAVLYLLK